MVNFPRLSTASRWALTTKLARESAGVSGAAMGGRGSRGRTDEDFSVREAVEDGGGWWLGGHCVGGGSGVQSAGDGKRK